MARLNSKWNNFWQRGQAWYHFWEDASTAGGGSPINITPDTGAIILTGYAPSVSVSDNKNVSPSTGQLALTGYAPTVTVSDNKNILPSTGVVVLTGYAPVVSVTNHINVSPGTGVIIMYGFAPTITTSSVSYPGTPRKRKKILHPRIRTRGYRK
jgi:hypothetical protein